ncbi:MAG: hypothetical protein LJE89_03035 [Deltaproteobacteria bacterium]|nr:hypothetical protein [Deltaproteobacteria bacterium]
MLHKSWLWLYSLLRTFLYWLSKVTMGSGTRIRRRLLKVREKKSLLKMGRRIQELHQTGENDWPGDSKVEEIIQELEDCSRKREELKSRLQERQDRFREKVRKLKEKESEIEARGEE